MLQSFHQSSQDLKYNHYLSELLLILERSYHPNIRGKWKGIAINFGNDDDEGEIDLSNDIAEVNENDMK